MRIFDRIFKPKGFTLKDYGAWDFAASSSLSGQSVDAYTAMQTSAVYACVKVLSEAVASLPFMLYETTPDGSKRAAKKHPLYGILHDSPNPEMTSFVFRETLMHHLLLWGNAYAQIVRNGHGEVSGLYPLLPENMTVKRGENGGLVYEYSSYDNYVHTFKIVTLNKTDILHIPGPGFDGLIGYSPIKMAQNAIGMSRATEAYGAKYFKSGASPTGVIETSGTIAGKQREDGFTPREVLEKYFRKNMTDPERIPILENGAHYSPVSIPPEQSQFLETRRFQIAEIARIFGVPLHMIGDLEKSSFSNISQQSLEFVKFSIGSWLGRFEQGCKLSLLTPGEREVYAPEFNVDGFLRGDYESRMKGYAIGIQNGFMSPNDVRELENMNKIPAERGGDNYMINGNMTKLENAGAFAKGAEKKGASENA